METLPTTVAPKPVAPTAGAPDTGPRAGAARIVALDGLRGVAVALVVVYHFAPDLLPAGFLGVDVFFVLSGFLITTLALAEHDGSGTVRVGAFFGRRARRLLPAAVACVLAVVVTTAVLEPASARGSLRGEAVASLLYGANWWSIAQGSSYQATFGAESPLNHFWSLAVEEQFYLLFPLVVAGAAAVMARRGVARRHLAGWLLIGATAGAVVSARVMAAVHDPLGDPSRAYLGSDARAQAVLVGVALACAFHLWGGPLSGARTRRLLVGLAVAGAAFLGWASATADFRSGWLYDGGFLVVALATAAVVAAVATGGGLPSRLLSARALCVLGLYSYGIYLWHWPVRVFVDTDRTGLDGAGLFAVRIGLTAVLTVASARLVEDRFRRHHPERVRTVRPQPWVAPGAWVATVAVATALVWVVAAPGPAPTGTGSTATAPLPPVAPAAATSGTSPGPGEPGRIGPATGPVRVLWTGDSVAWTLGGGALDFPQPSVYDTPFPADQVVIWNKASYMCPVLDVVTLTIGQERRGSLCTDRQAEWGDAIAEFRPDAVAWSGGMRDVNDMEIDGSWLAFGSPAWDQAYLDGLGELRRLALDGGSTLLLVGQPDPDPHPGEDFEEALLPDAIWRWGHLRELQRRFAAEHAEDTRYVDLQAVLCPDTSCSAPTATGVARRVDWLHWSREGAFDAGPAMAAAIRDALADPSSAAGSP